MDTSPWDTDTTVSGKGDDEWLPFEGADNSNGNDCGSDDWADFSNLDNSPASDGGPRVSSPDALVDGETFTSDLSKQTPAPSSQSNSDNVVSDSTQQLAPVVSIAPNSSAADGTLSIDESKQSTECAAKSSDVIVKSSDAITDSSDVILNSKDVIAESSDVMEVVSCLLSIITVLVALVIVCHHFIVCMLLGRGHGGDYTVYIAYYMLEVMVEITLCIYYMLEVMVEITLYIYYKCALLYHAG